MHRADEPISGDPDALALICKNGHNDGVHDKCYKNRYSNEAYKWEIVSAADVAGGGGARGASAAEGSVGVRAAHLVEGQGAGPSHH